MRSLRSLPVLRDNLHEKVIQLMGTNLNSQELDFLGKNYIARLATSSLMSVPHISPIYYGNTRDLVFFTTEKGSRKLKDIEENNQVSLVVDTFDADWLHQISGTAKTYEKAVVISGRAAIHLNGSPYMEMYKELLKKYPDYQADKHWEPGELPIVKIVISNVVSWGLN